MSGLDLQKNLVTRVNVGDMLTRTAWRLPEREAVVDDTRRLTYRELNAAVNRLANALLGAGYRRGDVLALACGNSIDFLLTYYACAKTGVVCVPLNLAWGAPETAYVLEHSCSRGVVVESQLTDLVIASLDRLSDDTLTEVIVAPVPARTGNAAARVCGGRWTNSSVTRPTSSRSASSMTATRSATSIPAARRRPPRALSAVTSLCMSSRSRRRWCWGSPRRIVRW